MYQRCYNENNKEQFPSTYFSYEAIIKLTLMRRDISINVFSISPYKKLGCFHPDIALRKKPILQAIGTDFQAISTVISFATSFNFSLIGARSSRLSRIFDVVFVIFSALALQPAAISTRFECDRARSCTKRYKINRDFFPRL